VLFSTLDIIDNVIDDRDSAALVAKKLLFNMIDHSMDANWLAEKASPPLYDGKIQGGKTKSKWEKGVLFDWAERWKWTMD
jgi:hypothetical protein